MQITVQFFSQLREIAGAGELTIELPEGSTVEDLLKDLYRRFPELRKWDKNLLVGAELEFVERSFALKPNDTIAIMPPVQGG
jgi:MoaD family protein